MTKRLTALDTLRGLTIALMILVNTPGTWEHVFPPLRHAAWDGWTPTDLVFPFFLFIVGVSFFFSLKKYNHELTAASTEKILKRTLAIFLVGLLLNAFPNKIMDHGLLWQLVFGVALIDWLSMPLWKHRVSASVLRIVEWACLLTLLGLFFFTLGSSDIRVWGVLQRIALAFCLGAFVCLIFKGRSLFYALAAILTGYWLLMIGFGDLTLENNLVRKVDLWLLGEDHIYGGYGMPFDPEGLVSTIPSVGTMIMGFLSGRLINDHIDNKEQAVFKLMLFGFPAILLAYLWNPFFPINKPIWSSSYVLHTGGLAMILLAFCIYLVDIKGWKKWTKPFVQFGLNPLFIYALSSLSVKTLIYLINIPNGAGESMNGYQALYEKVFVNLAGNNEFGSFLFAVFYVFMHWVVAWVLYKREVFIKV